MDYYPNLQLALIDGGSMVYLKPWDIVIDMADYLEIMMPKLQLCRAVKPPQL